MKITEYNDTNLTQQNLLNTEINPIILKHYNVLLPSVHACLTVFATLSFKERTKPLSLMFEGSSGAGKTAVLQMTFPIKELGKSSSALEQYVYRSDRFTPKSFVSHAANLKKNDLEKVDLLPKLKDKVLVTKELAPIFRGRKEELIENFSVLISVLDGGGFTSDSGMRGRRGYEGKYIFNWIGATTPLPPETHRLMSQLGTRILFWEVPALKLSREDLIAYAERDTSGEAESECNKAVNNFLLEFFTLYPVGTVEQHSIFISGENLKQIVSWAEFLVKGRAEIKYEKVKYEYEPIGAHKPEAPYKVINYFKELVRGHALIHGRKEIEQADIDFISHIAISSIPIQYRYIIRELRNSGMVDSVKCMSLCSASRPTARKYLKELSLLGIAELTKGSSERNEADKITLAEEFQWLKFRP